MGDSRTTADPNRTPNRRGVESRRELLEAGWRLVEQMSLPDLLSSISAARVADEAGKTTGAFFHHFETTTTFVHAMVDHLLDTYTTPGLDHWLEVARDADPTDVASILAEVAEWDWTQVTTDPEEQFFTRSMFLISAMARVTVRPDGTTDADAIRAAMWHHTNANLAETAEAMFGSMGRRPIEPFDFETIALFSMALQRGLLLAEAAGIEVGAERYSHLLSAMSATMTSPVDAPSTLAAVAAELDPPPPHDLTWQLTDADIAVIDRLGREHWDRLTMSQLAEGLGWTARRAHQVLRTPRRARALCLKPGLDELMSRTATRDGVDPWEVVGEVAEGLADLALARPHAAEALSSERNEAARIHGIGAVDGDIRFVVPIAVPLITAMSLAVDPAVPPEFNLVIEGALLANTILQLGITCPSMTAGEIAERSLRVVRPPGASSAGSWWGDDVQLVGVAHKRSPGRQQHGGQRHGHEGAEQPADDSSGRHQQQ